MVGLGQGVRIGDASLPRMDLHRPSTGGQPLKAGRQNRAAVAAFVGDGIRMLERLAGDAIGAREPRSRNGCDFASVRVKRSSPVIHFLT
jgi:hypothetical protein